MVEPAPEPTPEPPVEEVPDVWLPLPVLIQDEPLSILLTEKLRLPRIKGIIVASVLRRIIQNGFRLS